MTKQSVSKKAQAENKQAEDVLNYYANMKTEDVDALLKKVPATIEWNGYKDTSRKDKYPEFSGLTFKVLSNMPADTIKDMVLLVFAHQQKGRSAMIHEISKIAFYSSSNPNEPVEKKPVGKKNTRSIEELKALMDAGVLSAEDVRALIMGGN